MCVSTQDEDFGGSTDSTPVGKSSTQPQTPPESCTDGVRRQLKFKAKN